MKIGDLVRYKYPDVMDPCVGLLIKIDKKAKRGYHQYGVMWDFLHGRIGWQKKSEIEVIDESR